ncbi:MAG TPA: amidase [Candidatus Dormibacteraeota bacterium]|nr:amidase [Candidatus Dormibacteraeota bacterium]
MFGGEPGRVAECDECYRSGDCGTDTSFLLPTQLAVRVFSAYPDRPLRTRARAVICDGQVQVPEVRHTVPRKRGPTQPVHGVVASGDPAGWTVAELRSHLEERDISSSEVVTSLINRIELVDHAGASVRSVLAISEDAVVTARARDSERLSGVIRGPLHGIPILVKDNIDTATGAATTAGSLALQATIPSDDAWVVQRLRAAGAIVIGKTNLSEWANFRSRRSSSGWSAVGGQTRNPYVLDRSPGGSSSGSAAAVAAGFAPLAVGTETDGSILCPAALCGVVGIKPTVGRVSRTGVVPISFTQDTVGTFARSVADASILLAAIAMPDPADLATMSAKSVPFSGTVARGADGLRGTRIGVVREDHWGYSAASDALLEAALAQISAAGAILVEPADIRTITALRESHDERLVLLHEFKVGVERYLRGRISPTGTGPRSLSDLVAFNQIHPDRELAWFGQDIFVEAEATAGLEVPMYRRARARGLHRARTMGIDATLAEHNVVALLAPTLGPAWCIDLVNGDPPHRNGFKAAAIAGYPAITIPVGITSGLPVGLCLIGSAWDEGRLTEIAAGIESALQVRMIPTFLSSVPQ